MRYRYLAASIIVLSAACGGAADSHPDPGGSVFESPQCVGPSPPVELIALFEAAEVSAVNCKTTKIDGRIMAQFEVPGRDAIGFWEQAAAHADGSGYWPVILGGPEEAERTLSTTELLLNDMGLTPEQVLLDADSLVYETWLNERTDMVLTDIWGSVDAGFPSDGKVYEPAGGEYSYLTPRDILSGENHDSVIMAFVPAANSWESPAFMMWGCWNYNPCPEEHVAVLREWNDRYGAEVVAMSDGVMELRVARPPTDWEDALQLAWEQYVYDNDIVDQGAGSIEALAALLLGSDGWFFWWD